MVSVGALGAIYKLSWMIYVSGVFTWTMNWEAWY